MFVLGVLVATIPPLFMGTEWLPFIYRGLVVFVVSCSCGLALSVPVAVVAAMANAARHGTVFKGGAYLESVERVKVIAFDKTGTLTIGRPEVTDVIGFNDFDEQKVLELAGSIESRSSHPLATAIVRKSREMEAFTEQQVSGLQEIPGFGISAMVGGQSCIVGSPRFHVQRGISFVEADDAVTRLENQGKSVALVSYAGRLAGLLAIADNVRPGAVEALQLLHRAGVRTAMLTGDNERSAHAIAQAVGVKEYYAQLLPTDKVDVIRRLRDKHGSVAMVGDGINDAPAMAVADVGIAMGAAGTDIAIEAGDIVLMSDDLAKIGFIRELSSRTISTIRQNIVVSLVNVAFMVVMALLGYLELVTGLLLNEGSALFVIFNALRLLKWQNTMTAGPIVAEMATSDRIKSGIDNQVVSEASSFATNVTGCACGTNMLGSKIPPSVVEESKDAGNLEAVTFRIDGVCSCEAHMVEKRVKALKGVSSFSLNPITNQMKLNYDPSVVSILEIQKAVKKAGASAVQVILNKEPCCS